MSGSICLPWPPPALSPNARVHWARKAAAAKRARSDARILAAGLRGLFPAGSALAVTITAHPPSRRPLDADNLIARCKALLDGVADALGVDDRTFRPSVVIAEPRRPAAVVVTLEAA